MLVSGPIIAQGCYQNNLAAGKKEYIAGNYEKALVFFTNSCKCGYSGNCIEGKLWITKCDSAIKVAIAKKCYDEWFLKGKAEFNSKKYDAAESAFTETKKCGNDSKKEEVDAWLAKSCYYKNLKAGEGAFDLQNYYAAKNYFNNAKSCGFTYNSNEIETWLKKCCFSENMASGMNAYDKSEYKTSMSFFRNAKNCGYYEGIEEAETWINKSYRATYISPEYEKKSLTSIDIIKIEMTENDIVVYLTTAKCSNACIQKDTYIKPTGSDEKLTLKKAEDINMCEGDNFSQVVMFKLFFPKPEPGTNKIDLIEPAGNHPYRFYGISLDKNQEIQKVLCVPKFDKADYQNLQINKVEITSKYTIVHFYYCSETACANQNYYILNQNTSQKYSLIKTENIPVCKGENHENVNGYFALFFKRINLSKNTKIDIIENLSDKNAFNFYGVTFGYEFSVEDQ